MSSISPRRSRPSSLICYADAEKRRRGHRRWLLETRSWFSGNARLRRWGFGIGTESE